MTRLSRPRKLSWVGVLSFGSGLPFGIFKEQLPIWLRVSGVSVETIGGLSALATAWSAKLVWSPLVDKIGRRQSWIAASLMLAGGSLLGAAAVGPHALWPLVALLTIFTLAAATQDIAVDAYTIGILDKGEEGPANSARVASYRLAMWFAGGFTVALAGFLAWRSVLGLTAAMLAGLGLLVLRAPPLPIEQQPADTKLWRGLVDWMRRPGAVTLAAMVLLYKLPDGALGPMVRTFWVDAGVSPVEIGVLFSPLTILATIAGALIGGPLVAKIGILGGLFWFGLAQAATNLAYAAAAFSGGGTPVVLSAALIESLGGGMSTAAFLSLLMRVCEKRRAAVEYALLSGMFAATRDLSSAFSGVGVAQLGYGGFFAATTLLALPGLVLVFSRRLAARVGEPPLARDPSNRSGPSAY
ncbi:MAG: MFS transporter [Acidobacteriota bacterium]|nr:MAG: MFS transporter [Acidobacteriota bacterium]